MRLFLFFGLIGLLSLKDALACVSAPKSDVCLISATMVPSEQCSNSNNKDVFTNIYLGTRSDKKAACDAAIEQDGALCQRRLAGMECSSNCGQCNDGQPFKKPCRDLCIKVTTGCPTATSLGCFPLLDSACDTDVSGCARVQIDDSQFPGGRFVYN